MTDQELTPSKAEDFKARTRKNVKLPQAGLVVTIRKITALDIMTQGSLPLLAANGKPETQEQAKARIAKAIREDVSERVRELKNVIAKGVISPRVITGVPDDQIPRDAIAVADIAEDQDWLAMQILEFSGLTREAAQALEKFPVEEGASPRT